MREIITGHVLIIGSGGAGVRAAIEASKNGSVLLVSKTIAGKGGCTIMAEGGYNAVMKTEDCTDSHFEDTMAGGGYLNAPALVKTLVEEAPSRMADLIAWGAVFDVTSGVLNQRPFGGQKFPRTCYAGDRTGHEIMSTLMERLSSCNVKICHEISVIELLKNDDRVCGAIGLDSFGNPIIFLADAVILATGGGTRVYDISTNSAGGTGDGYAIAYRAGAELIDMEEVQFHPTGAVYPWDARGRLVTEAVRGEGGILKNVLGERFMTKYDPVKMELSTRDVVARACATEIMEGRGTEHGGVYLDVTHLSNEQIMQRLPMMFEQFMNYGVDIRNEPMEVAPTAHHIMGGVRMNPDCSTSLPGLFVCGEVSGGVHGANRLGGNALADTQVFGCRAGHFAGNEPERDKVLPKMAGTIIKELTRFNDGDTLPAIVKQELRDVMWKGAGIFRTESGLKETLNSINALEKVRLKAETPAELADCMTTQNMLTTGKLIVISALARVESRGAHVRTDIKQDWNNQNSPYGHTLTDNSGVILQRRNE